MTHYGIWVKTTEQWAVFSDGRVFWTTSLVVAEVQMMQMIDKDIEVRPFPSQYEAPKPQTQ